MIHYLFLMISLSRSQCCLDHMASPEQFLNSVPQPSQRVRPVQPFGPQDWKSLVLSLVVWALCWLWGCPRLMMVRGLAVCLAGTVILQCQWLCLSYLLFE